MNTKLDIYNLLRNNGQRITPQKKVILDVLLKNTDVMLSVNDILKQISDSSIDTVTIYRNMQGFTESGITETMVDNKGLSLYKICDSHPHHHMICTGCGKIINFPCETNFWEAYVKESNFTVTHHVLEIYGKCSSCSK